SEISWLDWEHGDYDFFAFVTELIALRQKNPVFRNRQFTTNEIRWYRNDGERMSGEDWNTPWAKAIGMYLHGNNREEDFFIAFNAHSEPVQFTIPRRLGRLWHLVLHTAGCALYTCPSPRGIVFDLQPHSMLVAARARE